MELYVFTQASPAFKNHARKKPASLHKKVRALVASVFFRLKQKTKVERSIHPSLEEIFMRMVLFVTGSAPWEFGLKKVDSERLVIYELVF